LAEVPDKSSLPTSFLYDSRERTCATSAKIQSNEEQHCVEAANSSHDSTPKPHIIVSLAHASFVPRI
jgi:hypothetical protein